MSFLRKVLFLPFARRKVDDAVVGDFAGILESKLECRGLKSIISAPLLDRLVEEAYVRAGAEESDNVPRYDRMWARIDEITEAVDEILSGRISTDPAIHSILLHHGVSVPTHRYK